MEGMVRRILCRGKSMTVIVLAGGRGRRMKADKTRLRLPGGTLLGRVLGQVVPYFDEVLVSVSRGQEIDLGGAGIKTLRTRGPLKAAGRGPLPRIAKGKEPRLGVVEDGTEGQGPMAGILAGLRAASNDACVVIACDIPDVHIPLVRKLARAARDAEIAVPVTGSGKYEPLLAVYSRAAVPRIEELLRAGERSLIPLFSRCRTAHVPLGNPDWLRNLNTRRDYEEYLEALNRGFGTRKSRRRPKKRP
jgi:molybdopterin-guanine dinucleotide biosynthesis protein A